MKIKAETCKTIHFITIDSTNEAALRLLSEKEIGEFSVIYADFQSKGQGVGKNLWHSQPAKNLLMSIVLFPEFLDPSDQFIINKLVSLAVCRCLSEFLPKREIKIKWPNDIYVDGRKIAGILSKNMIIGHRISSCIVGIGLNVNQAEFPQDLPNPVSMFQLSGKEFGRVEVLNQLTERIIENYQRVKEGMENEIDKEYLSMLLNFNRTAVYHSKGKTFDGIIRGVDAFGMLMLETEGEIRNFDMKEITLVTGK
jgi:BirA family transcriptional regulator, biotin operon repressor / biotin---[acetyl-CoA-carboxylase] ligase